MSDIVGRLDKVGEGEGGGGGCGRGPRTGCEISISVWEGFLGGGLSLQIPVGLSDLDL